MKKIIVGLMFMLLMAACSKVESDEKVRVPGENISVLNSLEIKINTDSEEYRIGDVITATAEIKNVGEREYKHTGSSSCDNELYLSATVEGTRQYLKGDGKVMPIMCKEDLVEFNLKPGQVLKAKALFQTKLLENKDLVEGKYDINAHYGEIKTTLTISIKK